MVASRQAEIPYYRGVGRQRWRGFGALAQLFGRILIPVLCKYVVPAAKRIGADMLEFAAPEIGEVISGRKSFKTAAKVWESKLWKTNWVTVVNRGESSKQNLLNNPVGRDETFLQTLLVDHVKQFSVPTFCRSVWKSWRESSNWWRFPVLAWTRNLSNYLTWWKLHSLNFKTERNYYVDLRQPFLALKLKFVEGRGYDTYESKEEEHKDESVVFTETGDDEEDKKK